MFVYPIHPLSHPQLIIKQKILKLTFNFLTISAASFCSYNM